MSPDALEAEVLEAEVLAAVDAAREELVDLCARLVAARSINPPGDTRAAATVVTDYLRAHGLAYEVVAADPAKPNLVAASQGVRPGRHLVWNGHLDTMEPSDESAWTVPRLSLTRTDGRLYGLGMGNMKGAVAALCLAYRLLAARRERWAGRLSLTLVSDEVLFGDAGAAHLLEARPDLRGDGLLSGEGPGFQRVAVAEKGVAWFTLTATGEGGHASAVTAGRSAVARLAAVVTAIDGLNGRVAPLPQELAELLTDPADPGVRLSANVATLAAGTVPSQIATTAEARVDVRLPPGWSLADVEALVAAICDRHDVRWRRDKGWEASWTGGDEPLVRTVLGAATTVRSQPPTATVRLPGSDATRWRALGVPAVCYGPQPTYSAGVDDHALEQDVIDCAKVYALTALRFGVP